MNGNPGLMERWRAYRPSKAAYFWSCVACIAATIVVGFTWGGWTTGGAAADRAKLAVQAAEARITADLCVSRFDRSADAAAQLAALKRTDFWQRDDFIAKGPWLKLPGMSYFSAAW